MISTGQLSDHEDDIFEVHSRGIIDELMYIKRTSYYVKIQEMAPEMTPEMVIRPDVQTIDTVNRVVIISYDRLSELIRAVRMVTEDE